MIYLDYSATTPVNDSVLDTYVKVTKNYIGNPNSLHKLGLESSKLINDATRQIKKILDIEEKEIIYKRAEFLPFICLEGNYERTDIRDKQMQ